MYYWDTYCSTSYGVQHLPAPVRLHPYELDFCKWLAELGQLEILRLYLLCMSEQVDP